MVVARDRYVAEDALEAVVAGYEPLPVVSERLFQAIGQAHQAPASAEASRRLRPWR